jgi:hypothetical protein
VTSDWSNQDYTGTPIPRTLRIIADPGGTTDPSPGDYTYSHGAQVSVTAIPDSGYEFSRWAEDLPLGHEKDNPLNLSLDSNKTVRATFEKKAACFVATAAYGSAFDPQVKTLQDFRDKYLIPYKLGREIVELYYKYSPAAANLISKHRILRFFARLLLLPILTFSASMLRYGPLITAVIAAFIIGFSILAVRFYRKKLRARR